jgi:hypothetical protein
MIKIFVFMRERDAGGFPTMGEMHRAPKKAENWEEALKIAANAARIGAHACITDETTGAEIILPPVPKDDADW